MKFVFSVLFTFVFSWGLAAQILPAQVPTDIEKEQWPSMAFRQPPITVLSQFTPVTSQFGQALFRPWNGSFWPYRKGLLAHRYEEPNYPKSENWQENFASFQTDTPDLMVATGRVDTLSPAEKYDYLMEDPNWSFTRANWNIVQESANSEGKVSEWFGICNGWSGAAHNRIPEPRQSVTVTSPSGRVVTFFPSDIKGLLSYLWKANNPATIQVGKRCWDKSPIVDQFGRILESTCLDTNPMLFHVALTNRVGRDGDSFIFDSSIANAVWNYAVDSYYFRFFNPMTMKPERFFENAIVARDRFVSDRFAGHRADSTKYMVGVIIEVFYPIATKPKKVASGTTSLKSKQFVYDLELDANYQIIGGEWHSYERPDFIWTFPYDGIASTPEDRRLATGWDFVSPMPAEWADLGRQAGSHGRVLATVVNGLAERSKKPVLEEGEGEDPIPEIDE